MGFIMIISYICTCMCIILWYSTLGNHNHLALHHYLQEFSNLSMYQSQLEALVRHRFLGPTLRVSDSVVLGTKPSNFFFFFFAVLEFELRALYLLGRHSLTGATPPALFTLVVFQIRYHVLPRSSIKLWDSYLHLWCSCNCRQASPHQA
jgi:hypothetical protein